MKHKSVIGLATVLIVLFTTPVFAQSIAERAAALAKAGDVDGAAALVTQAYNNDPASLAEVMETVAEANPSVAGAVLNVSVRTIGQTANASTMQDVLTTAVSSTLNGVNTALSTGSSDENAPTQSEVAENIAVNVRQAIVVVAGGDEAAQNTLLASARSGVQQSDLGQGASGTGNQNTANTDTDNSGQSAQAALSSLSGQLTGILNSRLSSTISSEERSTLTTTATQNSDPAPFVITQTTTTTTTTTTTPPVVTTPANTTTPETTPVITVVTRNVVTPDTGSDNRDNPSNN